MPISDAPVATPMLIPTLGEGLILLSIYKPLLMLAVFLPWAWVVSRIYDKHAAQFFLPRKMWNFIHLAAGALALIAVLAMSIAMPGSEGAFWAGIGIAIVLLFADLYAYMHVANRDERVPEKYHISLKMAKLGAKDEDKKKDSKATAKVKYAIRGADEKGKFTKTVAAPAPESPEAEVRAAAEKLYGDALRSRASQVELVPTGKDNAYQAKLMIDGVLQPGETYAGPLGIKIMDFWKAAAGQDVNDRRRKQQSNVQVEEPAGKHIVRVTSIGAQGGMRVTMLFDPESAVTKKAGELGLLEGQMDELKNLVTEGKGVVLVVAPPDGGRTTLIYSILGLHDAYTTNVQTVEMDQQATMEGVRHNVFSATADGPLPAGSAGPEFSTLVRSILRRDPQVVAVSDLPDVNTAKEIVKADHERTRTYVSFRAGDPLQALQVWMKMAGEPKPAAECIHGVITGKLVRRLCTNCRVAYPPAPDMLKKLGIPEGKIQQLFKKGGQVLIKNKPDVCPVCQGIGYVGQEGVFEVAMINPEERSLLMQGNFQGVKGSLRKRQIPTLQHVAIRKAVDGTTSVEEVMRITAAEAPAATAAPAKAGTAPATT